MGRVRNRKADRFTDNQLFRLLQQNGVSEKVAKYVVNIYAEKGISAALEALSKKGLGIVYSPRVDKIVVMSL